MSWLELLLIPLGFAAGAYGTLVGAGGGFIVVPALLLFYSTQSQQHLTAISLAMVLGNSISGTFAFARQRLIDYRAGLTFAAATVPSSFAGAYAVRFLPREVFDVVFGALLIALALFTVYGLSRRKQTLREPLRAGPHIAVRSLRRADGVSYRYAYDSWQGIGYAAVVGFASSLFGVGGGIMQVPLMVTALRFPIEVAVATSQFMIIFMASAGTALHLLAGEFGGREALRAALLTVGAIPGAQAGAWLAPRVPQALVVRLLATGLVLVGARLVLALWV